MILSNPDNRKMIIDYLKSISENDLISQFIIPIFSHYGFRVYRMPQHGPGEHGKDVIFVKYDPLAMAEEFIAVQAKAEKVSTGNVSKFADQINRAMKVGFPRTTGTGNNFPNYVFFINSMRHSNDADTEFLSLVDRPTHTRIFSQENLCDLILISGVVPKVLLDNLSLSGPVDEHNIDSRIFKALLADNPRDVDRVLDHEAKLLKGEISPRIQTMIIDFAFKKWDEDSSWSGTVRPMRWLDEYFEFISQSQYRCLMKVVREFTSSYQSYEASANTNRVFAKIAPKHIAHFSNDFVRTAVEIGMRRGNNWQDVVKLARSLNDSKLVDCPILDSFIQFMDTRNAGSPKEGDAGLDILKEKLEKFLYPDEA